MHLYFRSSINFKQIDQRNKNKLFRDFFFITSGSRLKEYSNKKRKQPHTQTSLLPDIIKYYEWMDLPQVTVLNFFQVGIS